MASKHQYLIHAKKTRRKAQRGWRAKQLQQLKQFKQEFK